MRTVYSILVNIAWFILKLIANFNPKIKLFVNGRKDVFTTLKKSISKDDKVIWMHVASLGEYEQGLPILEELKTTYPKHKIALTFFSPSGYEIKKNTTTADIVTYLPLDTKTNASKFIQLVQPEMALFIKYEIWPNYLNELKEKEIPGYLIAAKFSIKQVYFKWYGSFMKKSLSVFNHIFVQDNNSKKLLNELNFDNVSVSGDTRFDRVAEILKRDNTLAFMERFKNDTFCFVAGSSWPEDERILVDFINKSDKKIKYVIAPHNIKATHISNLKASLSKKVVLYSQLKDKDPSGYDVLLIDTIGLLTKIYSYANIAYVGGAFKTGLHNTLEPAIFGLPIIIGPNYKGFKEAEDLVNKKGIFPIKDKESFFKLLSNLLEDQNNSITIGKINSNYINTKVGATNKIMTYLKENL